MTLSDTSDPGRDADASIATIHLGVDPARVALIDGDERITYGELRQRVDHFRARLAARGVAEGDPIIILAGNEPDFATALLAITGLGAIAVPVHPGSPFLELERKLASVGPTLIVATDEAPRIHDHIDELDIDVVAVEPGDGGHPAVPTLLRRPDDIAVLLLTSGVSGPAKAAMLSHGNLRWVQDALTSSGIDGPTPDDIALGVLPFSHIFGLNVVLLTSLRVGATVVLERHFHADEALDLITRHGITVVAGAPPMWAAWAAGDGAPDAMASVRRARSGAAALPTEVHDAISDKFGIELCQGYGLTETSPVLTTASNETNRPASVGQPLPGVEIRLLEPDGADAEPGDTGEIWVRSPGVFKGYWRNDNATDEVLSASGWFRTGDVGVFDDDGNLYLVDRVKDLIIVSGFNVYPAEVEDVIMEHPRVRAAIVVGEPDARTGEAVIAHVSGDVAVDDLDAFIAERLSRYKRPIRIELVDDLPISPAGKLHRRELR